MRSLFIEDGWFGKLMRWLARIIDNGWIKFIVIPVMSTIPPTLIIFFLANGSTGNDNKSGKELSDKALQPILDWVLANPYWTVIIAAIYLVIWNAAIGYIQFYSQNHEEIDSRGLLTLFEVLESVVGAKAQRFGGFVKEFLGENGAGDAGKTFEGITKPDQQIALLANGIHAFFDAIDKDGVSFRVSVIALEDGVPSDYYYYFPNSEPPRTPIEIIKSDESSVSYCIAKKKILIISDLQSEAIKSDNRHYIPSQEEAHEEGSLLCYPVIHHYSDTVPYAITVVADKKGYFSCEKRKFYNWIFRHFAVRIGLEHSLLILKEGVTTNE